jgi:HD-like signal output (HDOD) protein
MLVEPLPDSPAWARYVRTAPIPVLTDTADELALLAEAEELHGNVDAHLINEAISGDPLMTLQVLAHVASHRARSQITDVHTVTGAVVLMGIGPFFRVFASIETVDQRLSDHPEALDAVRRHVRRAWCAARLVTEFALQHGDTHAAAMQMAALLHNHIDLLLWCHAPAPMLQVEVALSRAPGHRREDVERRLLHVDRRILERDLMHAWQLPELLCRLVDPDDERSKVLLQPQRRMLALAILLADRIDRDPASRYSMEELDELGRLLSLSPTSAARLVENVLE